MTQWPHIKFCCFKFLAEKTDSLDGILADWLLQCLVQVLFQSCDLRESKPTPNRIGNRRNNRHRMTQKLIGGSVHGMADKCFGQTNYLEFCTKWHNFIFDKRNVDCVVCVSLKDFPVENFKNQARKNPFSVHRQSLLCGSLSIKSKMFARRQSSKSVICKHRINAPDNIALWWQVIQHICPKFRHIRYWPCVIHSNCTQTIRWIYFCNAISQWLWSLSVNSVTSNNTIAYKSLILVVFLFFYLLIFFFLSSSCCYAFARFNCGRRVPNKTASNNPRSFQVRFWAEIQKSRWIFFY